MKDSIKKYLDEGSPSDLLFLCGDSLEILGLFPDASIDCIITSPPYFRKREYLKGTLGKEDDYKGYMESLLRITKSLYRVLKENSSFCICHTLDRSFGANRANR